MYTNFEYEFEQIFICLFDFASSKMGKMKLKKKRQSIVFSEKEWDWFAKTGGITRRELVVMQLMLQGWSNRKIAQGLNIKYNTVRAHISNIYKRIGVHSKVELYVETIRRVYNVPK